MNELVDRRILAAFCCVDAITGNAVTDPLSISGLPWVIKPNRSGTYVIFDGPGFHALTTDFTPANPPTTDAAIDITIEDPALRYLPRRATLTAPSPVPVIPPVPSPPNVFAPQIVTVYPAPSAPTGLNWAVVRVSVTRTVGGTAQGLPWAVVQLAGVTSPWSTAIPTGMTYTNGEALLAVPGLKQSVSATIVAWFEPDILNQLPTWIPDPDEILTNASTVKSAPQPAQLGVGQVLTTSISISV